MNYSIIRYILGYVLKFEAVFMMLPCITAFFYQEQSGFAFLLSMVLCLLVGFTLSNKKPKNQVYYAKEGFVMVSLSWLLLSFFGALPFVISREIPSFTDALFETISGFTTTGASILSDVEALSHCMLMWRSFTHWIGGMGVIVFILIVLPLAGGSNMYLLKTESPGPSVSKLVPRLKDTAKILYGIYTLMTLIEILCLLFAKMPLFDAVTTAFGTAGTGGFGIKNTSIQGYSYAIQNIITIFMILFGVNFNAYFLIFSRRTFHIFKMEEVRWYFAIIGISICIIAINTKEFYHSFLHSVQGAAFQVASIITTTGFSTVDFNLWPELSQTILVLLMMIGACAGSTGGGIKVSRIIICFKTLGREIQHYIHPRSIKKIKLDNKVIDEEVIHNISSFLVAYILIFVISVFLIAFDNLDLITNFTAVAATINNIGPGLALVGPSENFSLFSPFSKYILMFDMLAGRLELYPLLLLLTPSTWKSR